MTETKRMNDSRKKKGFDYKTFFAILQPVLFIGSVLCIMIIVMFAIFSGMK